MQEFQGIYFEKGTMQGCYVLFQQGANGFSIGTEEVDGPDMLIKNPDYVYLSITGANNNYTQDYYVVEDYDGPVKLRHSGHIYDFGTLRIQLV